MVKKNLFFLLFFFATSHNSSAYYDLDKKLQSAYSNILTLHFDEAIKLLNEEKNEKPGNDLRILYLNYIDFLKAFISEEAGEFEKFKKNSSFYFDELKSKEYNASSPYHLYVQSEILIQSALVRIKFNEYLVSADEIRRAYKLIRRNEKNFPDFMLNKKISGLLEVMIGSIPDKYHWMVSVAGMEGNIALGLDQLLELYRTIENTSFEIYRTEILFYLGSIYSSLTTPVDSLSFQSEMPASALKSPLLTYVYSNILSRDGKNEEAFDVLNKSLENYSSYPFTYLFYKRGQLRLRKLDLTSRNDFEYFLTNYKGVNCIKSAHQKLAWLNLLNGDTTKYFYELEQCKLRGNELIDEDIAAMEEAEGSEIINQYLLRSRLYFDGGYYENALTELTSRKINDFPTYHDQLEVTYRLGRIMQMTGKTEKAIEYFEVTIRNGISSDFYFAANSALMLGLIYEEKKDFAKAKENFQRAISIRHKQYKNSIDQKAHAGLDRIRAKT